MTYTYQTQGTCAKQIVFDVENGIVKNVQFINGCKGNLIGLSRLVEGLTVDEVIRKLEGIPCLGNSSCPDQLAQALKQINTQNMSNRKVEISQKPNTNHGTLKKAYVDPNICDHSPACPAKKICPQKAITQDKTGLFKMGPAKVNPDLCTGCRVCVNYCPQQAISMR